MSILDKLFKTQEQGAGPIPKADMTKESGVSGDVVFGSYDHESARTDEISIKDYRKMREDATVESLYKIVSLPILACAHGVKADENDEGEEQANFIRSCLFDLPYKGGMELPFSLVLEQMLKAMVDGFACFERIYKMTDDGKIVVKKLAIRDATTLTIKVDDKGGYNGVHQRCSFGDKYIDVDIPAYKTFLFTYNKADEPYYGRSAFKSIYKAYDKKQKIEYLDSIAIQNSAIKPKLLRRISDAIVKTDGDRKKALSALARLGTLNPTASIPYGYDVEELQGGDNSNTHQSIERQNSEMARAFLASFSLLGSQGSGSVGSYALSADQSDLFMTSLSGIMNLICEHINQYWIADLIDLNFPAGKRYYPEFYFEDMTESNQEFLKNAFLKLIEKDRLPNYILEGLEQQIATKFEIKKPTEPTQQTTDVATEEEPTRTRKKAKEDNGDTADIFPHRKPNLYEKDINWERIVATKDKQEQALEAKITPILEDFADKVANNPNDEIKLPKAYEKALKTAYKESYNSGVMTTADEAGEKAPKTADLRDRHMNQFVNFIIEKQQNDVNAIVDEQKLKIPIVAEGTLTTLLKESLALWISQAINGTKTGLVNDAFNSGRVDTYQKSRNAEESVYMWSALLENTCKTCDALDETVVTYKQMLNSKFQPGQVHLNCRCIWVKISGEGKPKATGFPDNLDLVNYIQTTRKAELIKKGLIPEDGTKQEALERASFNQINSGDTLDEVERNIRDREYEVMAAFDAKGNKLAEITDGKIDQVSFPAGLSKYLQNNGVSAITHNHPGNSSLSGMDIALAQLMDLEQIRAVGPTYTYELSTGGKSWPHAMTNQEDFADWFNDMYIEEAEIEWSILRKTDGTFKKMSDQERWEWITNQAVEDYAKDYNLIYKRSEK